MEELYISKSKVREIIKELGGHDRYLEIIENIVSVKYKGTKIFFTDDEIKKDEVI